MLGQRLKKKRSKLFTSKTIFYGRCGLVSDGSPDFLLDGGGGAFFPAGPEEIYLHLVRPAAGEDAGALILKRGAKREEVPADTHTGDLILQDLRAQLRQVATEQPVVDAGLGDFSREICLMIDRAHAEEREVNGPVQLLQADPVRVSPQRKHGAVTAAATAAAGAHEPHGQTKHLEVGSDGEDLRVPQRCLVHPREGPQILLTNAEFEQDLPPWLPTEGAAAGEWILWVIMEPAEDDDPPCVPHQGDLPEAVAVGQDEV